jgi:hypothetical protein
MVIYQNYTTVEGVERVKAYSDKNVYIERDGALYSEADDFAYQQRVYAETDIPIEPVETTDKTEQKAETDLTVSDTLEMLGELGVDTNDKNETSAREGIKEWINPKESQKPYNKNDKCYYKEQFWVSTIDNNISEPGGLANTWINI